jgi:hypothetical protein
MKLLSKERDGKKIRCVYDPAKTPREPAPAVRDTSCPEATRTDRGGAGARSHRSVPTTRAVATGRVPLRCRLLSFCLIPPFRPSPRLFCRTVYSGKASGRKECLRSTSRTRDLVPRAGAEKTGALLSTHPQRSLRGGMGANLLLASGQSRTRASATFSPELQRLSPGRYQPLQIRTREPRHTENTSLPVGNR